MRPEDLRAFAQRRWDLVADSKLRFIGERFRAEGPLATRRVARRLAERWAALHPGGPSAEARRQDLSDHLALKAKLDRASHAFRRR